MPRALNTTRISPRSVSVTCIDNGNSVPATLTDQLSDRIVVELPGGVRLTMLRHHIKKHLYIASHSGMEFECNPTKI